MAVQRMEGFFHFNDYDNWARKGHNGGGVSSAVLPAGGRQGRGALLIGLNNTAYCVMKTAQKTVYPHFAFKCTARVTGQEIACCRNVSTSHVYLLGFEDGSIGVYNAGPPFNSSPGFLNPGTTLLGLTNPNVFRAGVFHHFQFKVTIDPTVGEVYLKVDGIDAIHLTNVNTYGSAGPQNMVQFGMGSGLGAANHYYSDLVLVDTVATDAQGNPTTATGFLGDVAVREIVQPIDGDLLQWLRSTGAGTWSSHVDQNPQTFDAIYLSSDTAGQMNTFFAPNLSSTIGTIIAFKNTVCHRKTGSGFAAMRMIARSNDAVNHFSPVTSVIEEYKYDEMIYEADPKDASGLTAAKIQATQLGMEHNA